MLKAQDDDVSLEEASPLEPLLSTYDDSGVSSLKSTSTTSTRRRWTWKHAAGIGLGSLVVLGVVLGLCIRPLALKAIDGTCMEIRRMELQTPRGNTVQLTTQLAISSDSIFGATMHPTNMTIQYKNNTVGVFATPSMDISQGTVVHTITNATLTVTNMTAWTAFASEMIESTNMTWSLDGRIDISLDLFGIGVTQLPIHKAMLLPGMQGLRALAITKMDLSTSTPTAVLATVDTCLFNPSAAALVPVGALCFEVFVPNPTTHVATLVGRLTTDAGAALPVTRRDPSHPACVDQCATGMNSIALAGRIISTDPNATSALISQYLSGAAAKVEVRACWPGASSIPLYNEALRHLRLNSTLPPNPIPLISAMAFDTMALDPKNDTSIGLATRVIVTANSPLGNHSPLVLSNMHLSLDLLHQDVVLGQMAATDIHVDGEVVAHGNLTMTCNASLSLTHGGQPFGEFVHALVAASHKTLLVRGSFDVLAHGALGTLTLQRLPVDIASDVVGMNGLSNVSIVDFMIPGPHVAQGQQVRATSDIWNPSPIAMAVGAVQMAMRTDDRTSIGLVSTNISLEPVRATRVQLTGVLNPTPDAAGDLSPAVNAFFSHYISNQTSTLDIEIVDVASPIPWIQRGLQHLALSTAFPGVAFQLVSTLAMPAMLIHFDEASMHMHAAMRAGVAMPSALAHLPINITRLSLQTRLVFGNTSSADLCRLSIRDQAVVYTSLGVGQGQVEMASDVALSQVDTLAMAQFISHLMFATGTVALTIQSRPGEGVNPVVETPMGRMTLTQLPVDTPFVLDGMQGFVHGGVNITAVDILSGTADTLVLSMALTMQNPSQVTTVLDSLTVQVLLDGSVLGLATMAKVTLACCNQSSPLVGLFSFRPESPTTGHAFLSRFVSGVQPQEVHIQGTVSSSPNPYLQLALSKLHLTSSVAPLAVFFPATPTLVALSKMYRPSLWDLFSVATALRVRNPFAHEINVTAANLLLYPCASQQTLPSGTLVCTKYYPTPLARFHPTVFEPMVIPAKTPAGCFTCCQGKHCDEAMDLCPGVQPGKCMQAKVEMSMWSVEVLETLYKTMTTGLLMHVEGNLTAMVDAFPMELAYTQDGLLVQMA
ncbi:Aste57867_13260 [Aphanomyces stellatus]|uniref:Aste57867_13260 protein n=1 Tax=Aphanomyces stellatus TaxID=120398 RepID=A0A485KZD2_9STRA|nr:hypothetical protein As57867_013211 [Aphanomyces stellatus]VFT90100.1 Aste57867_13260 [Aphanomyces stellatus]